MQNLIRPTTHASIYSNYSPVKTENNLRQLPQSSSILSRKNETPKQHRPHPDLSPYGISYLSQLRQQTCSLNLAPHSHPAIIAYPLIYLHLLSRQVIPPNNPSQQLLLPFSLPLLARIILSYMIRPHISSIFEESIDWSLVSRALGRGVVGVLVLGRVGR